MSDTPRVTKVLMDGLAHLDWPDRYHDMTHLARDLERELAAAERVYQAIERQPKPDVEYAERMRALLDRARSFACSHKDEINAPFCDALCADIDAALAKNPNPSGHLERTREAAPLTPSRSAGLGPCEHLRWFVSDDKTLMCGTCRATKPRDEVLTERERPTCRECGEALIFGGIGEHNNRLYHHPPHCIVDSGSYSFPIVEELTGRLHE